MSVMRHLCAFLVLTAFSCMPAYAASSGGTEHVKVELLADRSVARPGETVTLAITQDIIPEWHTYWRNPGDSGYPSIATWGLPAGWTAGPILWPTPERLPSGPLVNYGYAGHVVLLTEVKIPQASTPGSTAAVHLGFSWLVCQESCIPESADLDLALPIASPGQAAAPANTAFFQEAREHLPKPAPFKSEFSLDGKVITLRLHTEAPGSAFFFPVNPRLLDNSARQVLTRGEDGFTLKLERGPTPLHGSLDMVDGVLEFADSPVEVSSYAIAATGSVAPLPAQAGTSRLGLLAAIGLALLGGMILNLMPCVFPVLSLKVLALARHAQAQGADKARYSDSGVAYAAGILVAFALIAALLLGLRSAGHAVGWGFQLQSPIFVLCLAWMLFVMGLSLSGLFTVSDRFVNFGSRLAARRGFAGSFFTGALAALVATPCSAPFMSTAVGFAVTQPWPMAVAIIEALGVGLALPYVLLASWPRLVALLPRPGAWMDRLKQFLAFPLYGSAVWLLWVLSLQAGPGGVLVGLGGAVLLAFALWCLAEAGRVEKSRSIFLVLSVLGTAAALAGLASPLVTTVPQQSATSDSFIPQGWESYSDARLQELQRSDKPVFVDLSAAWCLTCILNEKVALDGDMTAELHRRGIVLLKGDWTNQDPAITALLASFGRNGVPLYVYYPPGGKPPVVLPQVLTSGEVTEAIGGG